MNKLEVHIFFNSDEKYCYDLTFGELLLKRFKKDPDQYPNIKKEFDKKEIHENDVIENIFQNQFSLNFMFAKRLNLKDSLSITCFKIPDQFKKELQSICHGLDFILIRKHYYDPRAMHLQFFVVHEDFFSAYWNYYKANP